MQYLIPEIHLLLCESTFFEFLPKLMVPFSKYQLLSKEVLQNQLDFPLLHYLNKFYINV